MGTLRFLLSLLVGTEIAMTVCVSGFVSKTTEILYREDGNGGGGVNVNVCVSRTVLVFETVVRLVFV